MNRAQFNKTLLAPRYWPTWLAIGLWYLVCMAFPLRLQVYLGSVIGRLLCSVGSARVTVAKKNIALCFPEKTEQERQALLVETLESSIVGAFETGIAWFWSDRRFNGHYEVIGREHVQIALDASQGVLFLGVHFTTIEIGASIINLEFPISGFYRPHKNPVYEYIQAVGRTRRNKQSTVIPNGDVRAIVKALKAGKVVNYAPDQDYGAKRSVFVPFFGVNAATVKAPTKLASFGNAEIIPWTTRRNPKTGKYTIEIFPSMTKTLGKSDVEDAMAINCFVEAQVRKNPSQYLWVHRRFKTRPKGEPSFYK